MGTMVSSETNSERITEGVGTLFFLDEPAFETESWQTDDGRFVLHAVELDLVAFSRDRAHLPEKLGSMIFDLYRSLSEDSDLTDEEQTTQRLIAERLGPTLVKYHRRTLTTDLFRSVKRRLRGELGFGVGQSTLGRSDRALRV